MSTVVPTSSSALHVLATGQGPTNNERLGDDVGILTQQQMDCRYRIEAELFIILVIMIVPSKMNGNKKQTSNLKLIIQDQFSTYNIIICPTCTHVK